mmetsp:Transcript_54924/g.116714  ORF Transcript_54924/g.116714 Transcript_54924/m.116714 type:complete len:111 (-) Transcript_54924:157-489(-)
MYTNETAHSREKNVGLKRHISISCALIWGPIGTCLHKQDTVRVLHGEEGMYVSGGFTFVHFIQSAKIFEEGEVCLEEKRKIHFLFFDMEIQLTFDACKTPCERCIGGGKD